MTEFLFGPMLGFRYSWHLEFGQFPNRLSPPGCSEGRRTSWGKLLVHNHHVLARTPVIGERIGHVGRRNLVPESATGPEDLGAVLGRAWWLGLALLHG